MQYLDGTIIVESPAYWPSRDDDISEPEEEEEFDAEAELQNYVLRLIQENQGKMICTFAITGGRFFEQVFFQCSCTPDGEIFCINCAQYCHGDHEKREVIFVFGLV